MRALSTIRTSVLFTGLLCLWLSLSIGGTAAADRTVRVTLALICDIYDMSEQDGRGGFARVAGAVKAERARSPNVLVAHAGDTISPSLMSGFDKGAHIIELTNMIAPDVFVPGNHEFDFGEEVFRKRMAEAKFGLFAANLRDADGKPIAGFADTKIFEFEGVKIGVIGLTAENSVAKSSPGSLKFTSSVDTAREQAKLLREQGAHIVVGVAHAPFGTDLQLIYANTLDVLLSGDDHDLWAFFDGRTAFAEAKEEGEYVVAVDLDIKVSDKGRVNWWPQFRIIDTATVKPDAEVAAKVAEYQKQLSKELDVEIGSAATALDSRKASVRTGETAIGNLIADATRAAGSADVGIMNGGGIRGNRTYDAGHALTRRDVLTELPFGNVIMVVEMTGADLKAALENGVKFAGQASGRFAHISGAKIKVDLKAKAGERIVTAEIGGAPLDPARTYRVAANNFVASGKEGFDAFRNGKVVVSETDGDLLANAVMAFVREAGTVSPKIEGRIVME